MTFFKQDPGDQISLRAKPGVETVKTGARAALQRTLDALQFQFDAFPRLNYQPLPWLGKEESGRAEGTRARWLAIEPLIADHDVASAADIGCQAGFFSISLGERGVPTLGIDCDQRSLRMAEHAARRAEVHNVGFCHLTIDAESVALVPQVDAILAMSVWHHWVWSHGLSGANELLGALWQRCNKVLFFETGEEEMPREFGLPDMKGDSKGWLERYLADQCSGGAVHSLGTTKAFGVGGNQNRNVAYRHLFAVSRLDGSG